MTRAARSEARWSGYAPAMTEPDDDTVRSIIEQAREEILSDPEETDGKARQEAAE